MAALSSLPGHLVGLRASLIVFLIKDQMLLISSQLGSAEKHKGKQKTREGWAPNRDKQYRREMSEQQNGQAEGSGHPFCPLRATAGFTPWLPACSGAVCPRHPLLCPSASVDRRCVFSSFQRRLHPCSFPGRTIQPASLGIPSMHC